MCQNGILSSALNCFKAMKYMLDWFERCKRMDLIVTDIFEENDTYFK